MEPSFNPDYGHGGLGGFEEAAWVPVSSSNVEAVRFVSGNEYPLQVRFLAKGRRPSSVYEYKVERYVYDEMLTAGSQGKFVWHELRARGYPYRKLS